MTAATAASENFLKRGWHGREKLVTIFWLHNLLLRVGGLLVLWFVERELIQLEFYVAPSASASWAVPIIDVLIVLMHVVWWVFLLLYGLWCYVSIWRCAFNVKHRIWGYFARAYVVITLVSAFGAIVDIGR